MDFLSFREEITKYIFAEDMLQNTYIKVRNGSHLYTKQGTPMGWMCRVAKNVYLDHIRKYYLIISPFYSPRN